MFGIFNDNYPPIMDGVAMTAQNYATWLNRKGEEVCVVTAEVPGYDYSIEPYPIFRYKSMPIPMRKPYRFGLPVLDLPFRQQLKRTHFDLVHMHCPFNSAALARHVSHVQHVPMVGTFHSKYRQDFERVVPSKLVVNEVIRNIIRDYESCDEVWIPQASVEPTIREYGYKGHLEVVENGNDFVTPVADVMAIREARRAALGLKDGELMLLFVGQQIWEKNIGFILDALALIPELPYHLYLVGTGYAQKAIAEKVDALHLGDKVTAVGNIGDRELLKSYYAAADLFLFPSLYDNAPLVVREAAAMHTPSLMLQGSTASEIIRTDENGFLCMNDTHAYADLIRHLMENPRLITKTGDTASRTIARSWEDILEEVILRYRDIMTTYKIKHGIIRA